MKKLITFVLVIVIVVLLIFAFLWYVNNSRPLEVKLDYSCTVNSDCTIKAVGPDICYGSLYRCVNQNSPQVPPKRGGWGGTCMAESPKPDLCECQNSLCVSKLCITSEKCQVLNNPD